MQRTPFFVAALLASSLCLLSAHAADNTTGKRPFTFEDLMAIKRVGEPVPSPDGLWVVFAATDVNLEANTKRSHLWIVPAGGGEARRLNPDTENDESRPRFSPTGNRLIFTAKVGDAPQIWTAAFNPSGTFADKPHPLTALSTGADGAIYSPDGGSVVFASSVYPDAKDDAANKSRDDALKNSKVKAQIFTHLFYRHWNAFTENKRSHLFVVSASADASQLPPDGKAEGSPRDLTPGDHDVPPFSLGGQDDYAFSPDGQEIAYTSNVDAVEATSTNNEIFILPILGGAPKKISTSPGSDSSPVYSPDGKYIAWRSQARAGFESDKFSLVIYDRKGGSLRDVTAEFDHPVDNFVWAADSLSIYFTAPDHGQQPIYVVPAGGNLAAAPVEMAKLHADDLALSHDGKTLFFSRSSVMAPGEIAKIDILGPAALNAKIKEQYQQEHPLDGVSVKINSAAVVAEPVTHVNDALLSPIAMQPWEEFTFTGAEGAQVQGFLIKPPGFDPSKKYPVKFLIHGGPQGAWSDSWSYRWNPELFAASGYVAVMVNPHGSTGYGQAFTDAVSGDWGGKPYEDLMKGLDYVEATYPFIDKTHEAALGASYGGYMINWILGHTDRFRCLVSHDGLYNAEAAYGATEELWFNEWEYKGTPWTNPEIYAKWSPSNFAKNFKTPTLVIHGQLDYRLDVSQGFDLFTTLQRLGVPSEMLYFPDEGHWVLKPQNSRLWNKTVSDWVDRWTTSG